MPEPQVGYRAALKTVLAQIHPLVPVTLPLDRCQGCVLAEDVAALVDSPSVDTSMKDGYALRAENLTSTARNEPRTLRITGLVAAGDAAPRSLQPGTTLRIMTGGALPPGADTIVAEEFTRVTEGRLEVTEPTAKGRNIRRQGSDTAAGENLLHAGRPLSPGDIGLMAAAGHAAAKVYPQPQVAVIATGDEVLLPGQKLSAGKLYASNLLMINAWCRQFGMPTVLDVVGDRAAALAARLDQASRAQDAVITSGGAWTGDKDLMARVLAELGWQPHFHRLRLGPGKAAGFGFLNHRPVFLLPGGPPSNLVAFLLLALPGLLRLSGHVQPGLPEVKARLAAPVSGGHRWTQALFGDLLETDETLTFHPHGRRGNRLKSMARARGLLLIPEGTDGFAAGEMLSIHTLG